MKKYLFFVLTAAALVICAAKSYNFPESADSLNQAVVENLEALADDEGSELVVVCMCKRDSNMPICTAMGSGAYCGGDPCINHDSNCR